MSDLVFRMRVSAFCQLVSLACRLPDPLDSWVLALANAIIAPTVDE